MRNKMLKAYPQHTLTSYAHICDHIKYKCVFIIKKIATQLKLKTKQIFNKVKK